MEYSAPPTPEEITSVKEAVASFLTAHKNYDLYPPNHPSAKKFQQDLHSRLENFLNRYGELRLTIEKDRLLYHEVAVYEAQPDSENFAFLLFRDGLLWIQFQEGLTSTETRKFTSIISKYRVLPEESEGDIVTALWEEDLPHIRYEASEVFFEDVSLLDFSGLNLSVEGEGGDGSGTHGKPEAGRQRRTDSTMEMPTGHDRKAIFTLSEAETEILHEQIQEAEKNFQSHDILDVLLFILKEQDTAKDFDTILNFIMEESRESLANGEYASVTRLISTLQALKTKASPTSPWYAASIDKFIHDISDQDFLSCLRQMLPYRRRQDMDNLDDLGAFLRNLHPRAIETLGSFLPTVDVPELIELFLDSITALAMQDVNQVARLLDSEDEKIVIRGLQILAAIPGKIAEELAMGLVNHPSPRFRRQALRALTGKNPDKRKLFPMIDDPDPTVRTQALALISSERNTDMERMLLDYLEKNTGAGDGGHLIACFQALGKCGSKRCLPYLEESLFKKSWKNLFKSGESDLHMGAALALSNLDIPEASALLKKGVASLQADTRNACKKVLGDT